MPLPPPEPARPAVPPADGDPAPARHVAVTGNRIASRDLFVATREIVIQHGADAYRLRLTAQNKLILTK
ncbi:hemin uptake protein HemP [Rhodoplanes serenus]|uniref:Hemin uptake protein HemP n=1 Tax=Rhodoplanes serenus TaxID=200615 RepID=A0A9X4XLW3_9BRAD|nr:hemin uptake protein HemP [Rhodoplanes serenus]MTW17562.1 hemin uptake protein HemP [Rhodoplanes serenus]